MKQSTEVQLMSVVKSNEWQVPFSTTDNTYRKEINF